MCVENLETLLLELQEIADDGNLSDDGLAALSRAWIATHDMIVIGDRDGDPWNREFYRERVDRLYSECLERCRRPGSGGRGRMVRLLFQLDNLMARVSDPGKFRDCHEIADEFISRWTRETGSRARQATGQARDDEFEALRVISEVFYHVSEEDRERDEAFIYFKQAVASWVREQREDGHWEGVPVHEALERVEIMCRDSNMLLDSRHDDRIRKALGFYRQRVAVAPGGNIARDRALSLLHELNAYGGIGPVDIPLIQKIIDVAREDAARFPRGSDERLFCMALAIDCLCMKITRDEQQEMLANMLTS
jgi:hypothetical protein